MCRECKANDYHVLTRYLEAHNPNTVELCPPARLIKRLRRMSQTQHRKAFSWLALIAFIVVLGVVLLLPTGAQKTSQAIANIAGGLPDSVNSFFCPEDKNKDNMRKSEPQPFLPAR